MLESHFLPAAVYTQLRDNAAKNPNPVVMTKQVSQATSRQVKDYVLCAECEDRFSKYGETWVLGNMARTDGFKLQERLVSRTPIGSNENIAFYSTREIPEINMSALIYFAMSVFWRASAHVWRNASGTMQGIDLGPFEEEIRHFLLGGAFPEHAAILVTVWPTRDVLPAAYTPRRGRAPDCHVFNFLIPGLEFKLFTGHRIPEIYRSMCSELSDEKFIYSAMSVISDTLDAFSRLMETSRPSKSLQQRQNS